MHLWKKTFSPVGIFSFKMPLTTGCMGGNGRGNLKTVGTVSTSGSSSSHSTPRGSGSGSGTTPRGSGSGSGTTTSYNRSRYSSNSSRGRRRMRSVSSVKSDGKIPGSTWCVQRSTMPRPRCHIVPFFSVHPVAAHGLLRDPLPRTPRTGTDFKSASSRPGSAAGCAHSRGSIQAGPQ